MGQFNLTWNKESSTLGLGDTPRIWGSTVVAGHDSSLSLSYFEGGMEEVQCLDVAPQGWSRCSGQLLKSPNFQVRLYDEVQSNTAHLVLKVVVESKSTGCCIRMDTSSHNHPLFALRIWM